MKYKLNVENYLSFGVFAEFERNVISERTKSGLEVTKKLLGSSKILVR